MFAYKTNVRPTVAGIVHNLASCILVLCIMAPAAAKAQTPSPLQEWQFPGGIVLQNLFQPNVPTWQVELGAATVLRPIYDGARPYRIQPGPVINIRYRDIAFASIGEGIGVNLLSGKHYRAGIALTYDLGRRVDDYPSHLSGLGNISPAPVVKLFVSYAVSKSFPLVVRADVRRVVGGADGWIGDLGAYMPLPGSSKTLFMLAGPSITAGASNYMQNVFGVDSLQSISFRLSSISCARRTRGRGNWPERHLAVCAALVVQRRQRGEPVAGQRGRQPDHAREVPGHHCLVDRLSLVGAGGGPSPSASATQATGMLSTHRPIST